MGLEKDNTDRVLDSEAVELCFTKTTPDFRGIH